MLAMGRVSTELVALTSQDRGGGPPSARAPPDQDARPAAAQDVPSTEAEAVDLRDVQEVLSELVGAVEDYGDHLRSHTEILRSMSGASRDLASVVAELRDAVSRFSPPGAGPPRHPGP